MSSNKRDPGSTRFSHLSAAAPGSGAFFRPDQYKKNPDGIIIHGGDNRIDVESYEDKDAATIQMMRQNVAFIRACDMCKDATTGGSAYNIVPYIFDSIGGTGFDGSVFKRGGNFFFGSQLIDSTNIGKTIGDTLKNTIMSTHPKITKATGNIEIIELLKEKTKAIDNIARYTLDANIVPSYYKCTKEYKQLLKELPDDKKVDECTTVFDPKAKIDGKKYVITPATLLDPYKCTYGEILTDKIEIDENFMLDSGFIAGQSIIDINNIEEVKEDNLESISKKTDYTFDITYFKVCGIDFKDDPSINCTTSEDLINFCSSASNSDNNRLAQSRVPSDIKLLKSKLIAKECGDTLQAAVLNRINNEKYQREKLTLLTGDKGTFLSCVLYNVPSIFTVPDKRGDDVCYYFDPVDNPSYDLLLQRIDILRDTYNMFIGGQLGMLRYQITRILSDAKKIFGSDNWSDNYWSLITPDLITPENPLPDSCLDNLYITLVNPTSQIHLNQHFKWLCKLYLILVTISKTIENKGWLSLEDASYNDLISNSKNVTLKEFRGNWVKHKDLPSDITTFTYWNNINNILSLFLTLNDFRIHEIGPTINQSILDNDSILDKFEKRIKGSNSKDADIDFIYKYITSKFPLSYVKSISNLNEVESFTTRYLAEYRGDFTHVALNRYHNFNNINVDIGPMLGSLITAISNDQFSLTKPIIVESSYIKNYSEYKYKKDIIESKRKSLNRAIAKFFSPTHYKQITTSLITSIDKLNHDLGQPVRDLKKRLESFKRSSLLLKKKNQLIEDSMQFIQKIIDTVHYFTPSRESIEYIPERGAAAVQPLMEDGLAAEFGPEHWTEGAAEGEAAAEFDPEYFLEGEAAAEFDPEYFLEGEVKGEAEPEFDPEYWPEGEVKGEAALAPVRISMENGPPASSAEDLPGVFAQAPAEERQSMENGPAGGGPEDGSKSMYGGVRKRKSMNNSPAKASTNMPPPPPRPPHVKAKRPPAKASRGMSANEDDMTSPSSTLNGRSASTKRSAPRGRSPSTERSASRGRSASTERSAASKKTKTAVVEEDEGEDEDEEEEEEKEEENANQLINELLIKYKLLHNINTHYKKLKNYLDKPSYHTFEDNLKDLKRTINSPEDEEFLERYNESMGYMSIKHHLDELKVEFIKFVDDILFDIDIKHLKHSENIPFRIAYFSEKYKVIKNSAYTTDLKLPDEVFNVSTRNKLQKITRVQYHSMDELVDIDHVFLTSDQLFRELNAEFRRADRPPKFPTVNTFRSNLFQEPAHTAVSKLYIYMMSNLMSLIKTSIFPLFWCISSLEELNIDESLDIKRNIEHIKQYTKEVKDVMVLNYFIQLVYTEKKLKDGSGVVKIIDITNTQTTQPPLLLVINESIKDTDDRMIIPYGKISRGVLFEPILGIFNIFLRHEYGSNFSNVFKLKEEKPKKAAPRGYESKKNSSIYLPTADLHHPPKIHSNFKKGGSKFIPHLCVIKFSKYLNIKDVNDLYEKTSNDIYKVLYKKKSKDVYEEIIQLGLIDTLYGNLGQTLYKYLLSTGLDVEICLLGLYTMVSMYYDGLLTELPYYFDYSDKKHNPSELIQIDKLQRILQELLNNQLENDLYECHELVSNNYPMLYDLFGKEIYEKILKKIFDYIYVKKHLTGYNVFRILRCASFYYYHSGKPSLINMHAMNENKSSSYNKKYDKYKLLKSGKQYNSKIFNNFKINDTEKKDKVNFYIDKVNFYIDKLNTYVFENIVTCYSIMKDFESKRITTPKMVTDILKMTRNIKSHIIKQQPKKPGTRKKSPNKPQQNTLPIRLILPEWPGTRKKSPNKPNQKKSLARSIISKFTGTRKKQSNNSPRKSVKNPMRPRP